MPALPYLLRRGNTYIFRIAVPKDLRVALGKREITRSLKTPDRRVALPQALHLAAHVTTLFAELRAMPNYTKTYYTVRLDLSPDGSMKIEAQGEPHEADAINSTIEVAVEQAREKIQVLREPVAVLVSQPHQSSPAPGANSPLLSEVIKHFLKSYPSSKTAMRRKHEIVLPIFLDIIGDKPANQIRQTEIHGFFATINALPPRFAQKAERLGVTLRELAEQDHEEIISQKSFLDTYKACVRIFLKESQREYHDSGFPQGLHANYDYDGDSQPRRKQRAFTPAELRRLFEGRELLSFARSPQLVHQFWLPVIGLFTGARVNEICQINPTTDFRTDQASGIPYLLISEDTAAGEGIEKSVKTREPRKVPLHPALVELGLPDYINSLKSRGVLQLFPAWTARGGRAAPNAIAWFSDFLKEIGLYGVPNERGQILLGMHAFRHTLLTYGEMLKPPINLACITGHTQGRRSDQHKTARDGYIDLTLVYDLPQKLELLSMLDFGLAIPAPTIPA